MFLISRSGVHSSADESVLKLLAGGGLCCPVHAPCTLIAWDPHSFQHAVDKCTCSIMRCSLNLPRPQLSDHPPGFAVRTGAATPCSIYLSSPPRVEGGPPSICAGSRSDTVPKNAGWSHDRGGHFRDDPRIVSIRGGGNGPGSDKPTD